MTNPLSSTPAPDVADRMLLISLAETSRRLNLSQRTVWGLCKKNQIPHVRVQRRLMFSPAALQDWIAQRTKGGQS